MDSAAPNLSDYVAEVRRGLRVIVVVALVGAVLGLVIWTREPNDDGRVATATVSVTDLGHSIDLLLGRGDTPVEMTMAPIVARLNADPVDTAVTERAEVSPSGVSVAASGDEPNDLITLRVTAPDDATAEAVVAAAIDELSAMQRDAVAHRYAAVERGAETAKADLEAMLGEIDTRLQGVPAGSAEGDFLVATGLDHRDDLDDALDLLRTIEAAKTDPTGGIQRVGSTSFGASAGAAPWAVNVVIGALLGGMLALGYLLVRRFMTSPTDSRGAVERCGLTCLAVTAQRNGQGDADDLAAALKHIVDGGQLVALAAKHVTRPVIDQISALGGPDLRFLDEVADASAHDRLVLVVDRRTNEDELRALAFSARSMGAEPIGVILTGIAPRDLNRAWSR